MTPETPDIAAIVPMIPQVLPLAQNLYRGDFLHPLELLDFVKRTQPIHLARLDDPHNPLIKTDRDGNQSLYQMWGHPKNFLDTNFLIALISPLEQRDGKTPLFKPSVLVRGPLANVMIVGGMSCCGSALQTHWSQVFDGGASPIDDARIPVTGLPDRDHAYWLKGKVHLAENQAGLNALHHMAMDVLAHRLPGDARFAHDCHAKQDYVGYSADAQRLTL